MSFGKKSGTMLPSALDNATQLVEHGRSCGQCQAFCLKLAAAGITAAGRDSLLKRINPHFPSRCRTITGAPPPAWGPLFWLCVFVKPKNIINSCLLWNYDPTAGRSRSSSLRRILRPPSRRASFDVRQTPQRLTSLVVGNSAH